MPLKSLITDELNSARLVLENFINDAGNIQKIENAAEIIVAGIRGGGKIIACGNGGSNCDAAHFAEELSGRFRNDRPGLPAIAITDAGHITCVGNDYGYDKVFSRFVEALGRPGDVLLAISTGGGSANVIEAAKEARNKGMKVIGLTGKNGGALAQYCDEEIRVPHFGYADRIQEIHIKVIHILILLTEKSMFPDNKL